ncbi:centrosomal protein of 290 kDa-like [Dorcoceras hygrometricum]|uniref:Centrosomal protein of 290 kDa-like n=1 Tax=Dorcoceras hygrometricum TaxID=472368 RepID=A0A2Z7A8H8_9LAMI|nr:centrosomal protein of 290 kDa-like [Dorcoceras hygrometricum]
MGSSQTKHKSSPSEHDHVVKGLKNRVRLLRGGIDEIMAIREIESRIYEEQLIAFAVKREKWRREKKRLKKEIRKLRMRFVGKEEERSFKCCMKNHVGTMELCQRHCNLNTEWEILKRDETLEKWKELYFTIKVELDELIQRTCRGERLCRDIKEEVLEEQKKELKTKEESIESLQAKLASMEDQEIKRQREVDILRQSLRIMSHGKKLNNKIGQTGY